MNPCCKFNKSIDNEYEVMVHRHMLGWQQLLISQLNLEVHVHIFIFNLYVLTWAGLKKYNILCALQIYEK